jgi:hypothetical protein
MAVDGQAQIVVAAELTDCAADHRQLPVMLDAVKATTGKDAEVALADAGYRSEEVLAQLDGTTKTDLIVAMGREGKNQLKRDANQYPRLAKMADKFELATTKEQYRRRKAIAEPPNGWVKHVLGFRPFSMRGITKVTGEWKRLCAALNLKRMANMVAV